MHFPEQVRSMCVYMCVCGRALLTQTSFVVCTSGRVMIGSRSKLARERRECVCVFCVCSCGRV